jgi:hypothetical protein
MSDLSEIYRLREFIPTQSKPTCYSCLWSIGTTTGLDCKLGHEAVSPCNRYRREVGADEPEDVAA